MRFVGAAGATAALAGIAKFDMAVFASGGLNVDIFSATQCDVVDLRTSLSFGDAATPIDVILDWSAFADAEGTYTYAILNTPSILGDISDINEKFRAVDAHGNPLSDAVFSYDNARVMLAVAIPEPAACGALLGALALGFAARRKRR